MSKLCMVYKFSITFKTNPFLLNFFKSTMRQMIQLLKTETNKWIKQTKPVEGVWWWRGKGEFPCLYLCFRWSPTALRMSCSVALLFHFLTSKPCDLSGCRSVSLCSTLTGSSEERKASRQSRG